MFFYPNKPVRIYDATDWASHVDLDAWIVQPKWNGHRALPVCDDDGNIIVYNRTGSPLALAKRNWQWLGMLELPRPWALDAELLRDGRMIVWDFAVMGGNVRFNEPYMQRLQDLQKLLPAKISKGPYSLELIETLPGHKYRNFMLRRAESELEGFVLKRTEATDLWGPFNTSENASQIKLRF